MFYQQNIYCGICYQTRVGQLPEESLAVTVIDGNALCDLHVCDVIDAKTKLLRKFNANGTR